MTFALIFTVCGLWALATPLYGSADEAAHVTHAAGIARGEFTGRTITDVTPRGVVLVELPASYQYANERALCFVGHGNRDASCFHIRGSETATELVPTDAGRHPPAYYVGVGLASRLMPTLAGAVVVMRVATLLMTALFFTVAVHALIRTPAPRLMMAGLAVALTPMVLAFSGVVNPSALEISAGVATWACGLVLADQVRRGEDPPVALVHQLGVAASAFLLSRQIAMLWLAIVGVTLAYVLGVEGVRRLWRQRSAQLWSVVIVACGLFQLGWIRFAHSLYLAVLPTAAHNRPLSEVTRTSIGRSWQFFIEMLGMPGSLDVRLPGLTYLSLTVALGFLVVTAVALVRGRYVIALLAILVSSAVIPVVLEVVEAREYGYWWQGRYTLPLAVGVPLLAMFALQSSDAPRRLVERSRFVPILGGLVVTAHFLAFYQALRRWSVGADGPILYWLDPEWSAPLSQWILLPAFAATYGAAVVWLLALLPSWQSRALHREAPTVR